MEKEIKLADGSVITLDELVKELKKKRNIMNEVWDFDDEIQDLRGELGSGWGEKHTEESRIEDDNCPFTTCCEIKGLHFLFEACDYKYTVSVEHIEPDYDDVTYEESIYADYIFDEKTVVVMLTYYRVNNEHENVDILSDEQIDYIKKQLSGAYISYDKEASLSDKMC